MNGTRFSLLAVGTRFAYEGKWYVKSAPLIAAAADGSGQRMIPRSALVELEPGMAPPARPVPEAVRTAALKPALARYHAEAVACARPDAGERLAAAYAQLLTELGI